MANIYGPNEDTPDFFMDVFHKLDEMGNANIIFAGDLNIAVSPLDYKGSNKQHANAKSREIFNICAEDFNLVDVWRKEHEKKLGFTRNQQNPLVFSRLDYIFVSTDMITMVNKSDILTGISSDHSIVSLKFIFDHCPRGRGYWKCNCKYLRSDAEFCYYIKDKIKEFREIHRNTDCNPNTIWDTFKCFITGYCIEYGARGKKRKIKTRKC